MYAVQTPHQTTPQSTQVVQKSLGLFFTLLVICGLTLGGIVSFIYYSETRAYLDTTKKQERNIIPLQEKAIVESFDKVINDLIFLGRQNELRDHLRKDNPDIRARINKEYEIIADTRRLYDKVRFLDQTGMEQVRVNYLEGSHAYPVSRISLQDKSQDHHFRKTFALSEGRIYASPLDLSITGTKGEKDYKPIIHFGYPVVDVLGKKRGIVLIDYLADHMLDRLRQADRENTGATFLLNAQGYWLYAQDASKQWGFMFTNTKQLTFAVDHSEVWAKMQAADEGQITTADGLFTYKKINPLKPSQNDFFKDMPGYEETSNARNTPPYTWFLVSHIDQGVLDARFTELKGQFAMLGAGLLVFIAFGAWHMAMFITKRRLYQAQLLTLALYDPLTQLPNRKLFFDTLESTLAHNKRHERRLGILFVDLDGFKAVNDTYGHEVGDLLLIHVGNVLKQCARKSDQVARLGGDEFAIILTEIHTPEDAMLVGNKIITALRAPIDLPGGRAEIGASIGVAISPDRGYEYQADAAKLLTIADDAMYQAKNSGKNTCVMGADYPAQRKTAPRLAS